MSNGLKIKTVELDSMTQGVGQRQWLPSRGRRPSRDEIRVSDGTFWTLRYRSGGNILEIRFIRNNIWYMLDESNGMLRASDPFDFWLLEPANSFPPLPERQPVAESPYYGDNSGRSYHRLSSAGRRAEGDNMSGSGGRLVRFDAEYLQALRNLSQGR